MKIKAANASQGKLLAQVKEIKTNQFGYIVAYIFSYTVLIRLLPNFCECIGKWGRSLSESPGFNHGLVPRVHLGPLCVSFIWVSSN